MTPPTLLVVGNPDPRHVGGHFLAAARELGWTAEVADTRDAQGGPRWRQRADWWLRGRRPVRLGAFSEAVVAHARRLHPAWVLTVGIAPVDEAAMRALKALDAPVANFLTDDPWNPQHRAPWFLRALRHYDHVFSPRHANLKDLRAMRGPAVSYLPFAYAPSVHFPEAPAAGAEHDRFDADVMFAGGADADRAPVLAALVRAGLGVAVYGGYWDRYAAVRGSARGVLDAAALRKATSGARVCLGLVRRANRDGHAMRSYEVPAMGGCLLVEDTDDHRDLFGHDDTAVTYFRNVDDAIAKTRALVGDDARRRRLAAAARACVVGGGHTYARRLSAMAGDLRVAS